MHANFVTIIFFIVYDTIFLKELKDDGVQGPWREDQGGEDRVPPLWTGTVFSEVPFEPQHLSVSLFQNKIVRIF